MTIELVFKPREAFPLWAAGLWRPLWAKVVASPLLTPVWFSPSNLRLLFAGPGAVGLVWFVLWSFLVFDSPNTHPRISEQERLYITGSLKNEVTSIYKYKYTYIIIIYIIENQPCVSSLRE